MKLVTYRDAASGAPRLGALTADGTRIVDVRASHMRRTGQDRDALQSMQSLIDGGEAALDVLRDLVAAGSDVDEVALLPSGQLLAPLPVPMQFRDALCFRDHLVNAMDRRKALRRDNAYLPQEQAMLDLFATRPFWYKGNRFAVVGPDADIIWPSYSSVMDYELEMGMILGRGGRDIPVETAADHIFGYTIFNDFSARDTQQPEMAMLGPTKSKDFDGANVFGPCIVTADEFSPDDVRMSVRINGELQSAGSSGTMHYSFPELIAFVSRHETLHAGEIICSGTVGGGCGDENGRFLQSGDLIELEVEGIGVLRNRVFSFDEGKPQ